MSQKSHFSKGVNPCLWSKNAFFFLDLFLVKKGLEIRFKDVLDRTESFYDYKNNIFQGLKNGIFPQGLTHAFGQKMQFFFLDLFSVKTGLEIRFNDVLDRKETFFDCKNNIFQRPQNRTFPKGLTNTFGKKKCNFFHFFCSAKIRLEVKFMMFQIKKKLYMTMKQQFFNDSKMAFFQWG